MPALTVDSQPNLWAAAPGTDDGTLVGRNSDDKVGFFGAVPAVRPTVSLGTVTTAQLATALASLGLIQTTA